MSVNKKEVKLLEFAKERIIEDIESTFLLELHINGRLYDNKPLTKSVFGDMTADEMVILLIKSYVDDTVNKIIYCRD